MKNLAKTFKIRASMLSKIMTDPRSKSEKLSETCKTYLEDRIKEKVYWRPKDLSDINTIAKGIECENEAVFILNKALWTSYVKSKYAPGEKMDNGICTGHEDIDCWKKRIGDDDEDDSGDFYYMWETFDAKVSISFDTFPLFEEDPDKAYYWQGQAYMWLKWEQYKRHTIAKVLVNTPVWMIEQKLYRLYNNLCKKYNDNMEFVEMEYEEKAKKYFLQNVFDQQIKIEANGITLQLTDEEVIPFEKRVNLTVIERNDADIAKITPRVQLCRDRLEQNWF